MKYFASHYDSVCYSCNGPKLFRKMLENNCTHLNKLSKYEIRDDLASRYDSSEMLETNMRNNYFDLCDVYVYPAEMFCPVSLGEKNYFWSIFFKKQSDLSSIYKEFTRFFNAHAIHLYNKLTAKFNAKKKESSAYELMAKINCPHIYETFF